jgi:hypothetical protein
LDKIDKKVEVGLIKPIELILHVLAGLAILGGIFRATTTTDPQLSSLLMSQYLLWAILFEIIAFNTKE